MNTPILNKVVVASLVLIGPMSQSIAEDKPETMVMVEGDSPEMAVAMKTAAEGLPYFIARFEKPANNERQFAIKHTVKDGKGVEHFWIVNLSYKDGAFSGVIGNKPGIVKNVKMGQRVSVPNKLVKDWLFMRGDKMVGNYTMGPLLKKMPVERQAMYKALTYDPQKLKLEIAQFKKKNK